MRKKYYEVQDETQEIVLYQLSDKPKKSRTKALTEQNLLQLPDNSFKVEFVL